MKGLGKKTYQKYKGRINQIYLWRIHIYKARN